VKGFSYAIRLPGSKRSPSISIFLRATPQKDVAQPAYEPGCNRDDDLICADASDRASVERSIANVRSRLGWGITHI